MKIRYQFQKESRKWKFMSSFEKSLDRSSGEYIWQNINFNAQNGYYYFPQVFS